jgi:amino acid adenylation domain-containing protein/non-ribosomal peptide synthase protein (TIGR01720 family)
LGVLKAGAAYVPLDLEYPAQRLSFMLADSGVSLVLGGTGSAGRVPVGPWRVVEADPGGELLAGYDADIAPVRVAGDSAAYVIYTSGSTGRPKGVTVTHSAVTRLLRWGERFFRFGPDDVWSMFHSTSFDFSVWEMWGALSSGGRLVVVPYWISRSPDDFYRLVAEANVSVLCQTPTSFAQLEAVDSRLGLPLSLRWVIFGGEALEHGPVRRWAERHGWDLPRLVNMYGITETTVHVTAHVLGAVDLREELSQIGREVGGLTAHVLDPMLLPVPVGAVGELYVGGARLARGYAGRPALTAERFVADPHGTQPGGRLYRTGDRVRLRPDGALEYVGRSDDMVNVKGFRVELGEIEASLARHPAVAAAAVTMRHDHSGHATLTGYVVPTAPAALDVAEARQWLRERLPEYMLPARLVLLGSLPVTPAGKVDRSALPEPGHDGSPTGPPPRTPTERILCELFTELLGVPEPGIDASFFELGGDSIMSIQLVSRARRAGMLIKPKDVYEKRTVRALAEVAAAGAQRPAAQPQLSGTGPVPLTPILAWARELGGPMDAFSQSMLIRVPAAHTPRQASQALQALLDHHDALRMVARIGPGAQPWELEIRPAGTIRAEGCLREADPAQVSEEDWSAHIAAEARAARARLRPAEGQLVQAVWFDAGQNAGRGAGQGAGHLLLLVIHHVAVDGVSWRIVLSDLAVAFAAIADGQPVALEPVATSLRHWAHQLTAIAAEASVEQHLPAWQRILGPAEPPLGTRPLDGDVDVFGRLQVIGRTVSPGCAAATLTTTPAAYRVGVDDILMAALALAMRPWLARRGHSGRTGVLLDVERHGRDELVPDADLSRTVGWFTSIHPVRLDPGPVDWREVAAGGPAASSAVKRIKEQVRGLPPGGQYGLLRYLNPRTRDVLAGMAAPQVVFNYLGRFPAKGRGDFALATGDLALQGGADPQQPLRHTLSIAAVTFDGAAGPELKITWAWPEGVLGAAEVADLADAWITALEGIVASSKTPSAAGHTPSDLTLVSLSQDEIDDLEEELSAPGGTAS